MNIDATFKENQPYESVIYFRSRLQYPILLNTYPEQSNIEFHYNNALINLSFSKEEDKDVILCTLLTQRGVSSKRRKEFENYTGRTICINNIISGPLYSFFFEKPTNESTSFWEFIKDYPIQILKNIMWRYSNSINSVIEQSTVEWSFDKEVWNPIKICSLKVHLHGIYDDPKYVDTDFFINEFANLTFDKPLYHELIQEAYALAKANIKASAMIGVTALEIGVKSLAYNKVSELEEQYKESTFPPLKDYLKIRLPELIPNFKVNSNKIDSIHNFITIRNQYVHNGKYKNTLGLEWSKLLEYLDISTDILYYIDYHNGFEWAYEKINIKKDFQK